MHHPVIRGLLLVSLVGAGQTYAQQVAVPLNNPPAAAADQTKIFDSQHLKDRPYGGGLPAPAFPSSTRVQRSFTVAYVYDYAYSTYTPIVDMPVVTPVQAKRDTPEAAAIAFFSAQRDGDFEAFLQCWTEEDRKGMTDRLKAQKIEIPALVAKWKQFYANKPIQLVDRIETTGYVILDVRVPGPTPVQMPFIAKLVKGEWLATNDLGPTGNPMLSIFQPDLAGIIKHVQPEPTSELSGIRKQELQALQEFVKGHVYRSEVDLAGQ